MTAIGHYVITLHYGHYKGRISDKIVIAEEV